MPNAEYNAEERENPRPDYLVRQQPDEDERDYDAPEEYQEELQRHYNSYTKEQQQFVRDMEEAGFRWYHYRGRWSYEGPAVSTSRSNGVYEDDVVRATSVSLGKESLGLGLVIWAR